MQTQLLLPVPEPEPAPDGIGWLRANVSRFANGPVHARRRAIVEELLGGVAPDGLRRAYAGHPVAPLARALGVPEAAIAGVVADVQVAAAAYRTGESDASADADAAVGRLVAVFGGAYDERTAAHLQLLVQAGDATATLIERARTRPVDEVLRDDPPVPATRRVAPDGTVIAVSLADAPFGAGPRACPGREHALALVEGALQ
jgi:cytochrome P450